MDDVRSILCYNPSKPILKDNEYAEEDVNRIQYLFTMGVQYARVDFQDYKKMFVVFDKADLGTYLDDYASGAPLPVDFRKVIEALEKWRHLLSMLRNIRDVANINKNREIAPTPIAKEAILASKAA